MSNRYDKDLLPFYEPGLGRSVGQFNAENIAIVSELLASEKVLDLAISGCLTLAMIRPSLDGRTNLAEGGDVDAAETIEASISELGVLAKFAVSFDDQSVEKFYEGQPRDAQLGQPPQKEMFFKSRWDEFKYIMTSGPTTILLLHSPNGDAIGLWRNQVGHWNIEDRRDPSTIRGRYGIDNYNNLIHGSDSPESVVNELSILCELLDRS